MRGLVDIVATDVGDYRYLNTNNTNDGNFDALRARLFVDGKRGNTSVYLQFLISPESYNEFRFFGGYIMQRVHEDRNIFLEAGLIPVHDGIWASHTYSNKNPLVGIPLHAVLEVGLALHHDAQRPRRPSLEARTQPRNTASPTPTPTARAATATRPCRSYTTTAGTTASFALGTLGRLEFAVGVTLGAPSATVQGTDINDNIASHAKLGYAFTPGFKVWGSIAHGAYLDRAVGPVPPGRQDRQRLLPRTVRLERRLEGLEVLRSWASTSTTTTTRRFARTV